MIRHAVSSLVLLLVAGTFGPGYGIPRALAQTGKSAGENRLLGTWKLVSARYGGENFDVTSLGTTLKHITPDNFIWVSYDPATKLITRAEGGSYTFKGERYEETPRYGLGGAFETTGKKPQSFNVKLDGEKWRISGMLSSGLRIEETWERVKKERAERPSLVPR